MTDCGIQIVRDRDGYLSGRPGSEVCADCGTVLCKAHAEACGMCLDPVRLVPILSRTATASEEALGEGFSF